MYSFTGVDIQGKVTRRIHFFSVNSLSANAIRAHVLWPIHMFFVVDEMAGVSRGCNKIHLKDRCSQHPSVVLEILKMVLKSRDFNNIYPWSVRGRVCTCYQNGCNADPYDAVEFMKLMNTEWYRNKMTNTTRDAHNTMTTSTSEAGDIEHVNDGVTENVQAVDVNDNRTEATTNAGSRIIFNGGAHNILRLMLTYPVFHFVSTY